MVLLSLLLKRRENVNIVIITFNMEGKIAKTVDVFDADLLEHLLQIKTGDVSKLVCKH
jgi:hypothetical protein